MNKRSIRVRKRNIIDDDYLMSDVLALWFCCNLFLNPSIKTKKKNNKGEEGGEGGVKEGLENKTMCFWLTLQELRGGPLNL